MKLFFVVLLGVLTASCASKSKLDKLPQTEKNKLQETLSSIQKLGECADKAGKNDAYFTSNCTHLLKDKPLYAKVRSVRTVGRSYWVMADVSNETNLTCIANPEKTDFKKLADLGEMDGIYVHGPVSRYTKSKYVQTLYKPERFGFKVTLDPCEIDYEESSD